MNSFVSKRLARTLTTLAVLLPLLGCLGCGGAAKGQMPPSEVTETADVVDLAESADLVLVPDNIPDLSHIAFEEVENFHVKFNFPSVEPSFTASSGTLEEPFVVVGGKVTPGWDSIAIRTDFDQEPVPVQPSEDGTFTAQVFLRPPVLVGGLLDARPTTIWVEAHKGERSAYDVAVAMANPGFAFPSRLKLTPDVLFAGESNELLFTLDLNAVENFLQDQVWVMEVDATCATKVTGSARQMLDNGDIDANGDQLARDRVYSAYDNINGLAPGTHFFRAALTTEVGGQALVAYSQCLPVRVVERISSAECHAARDLMEQTTSTLDDVLAQGWPMADARKYIIDQLQEHPAVLEVGGAELGDQVWIRFASGILGAVQPSEKPGIGSSTLFHKDGAEPTVLVQPWSRQVVSLLDEPADTHPWTERLAGTACPPWRDLNGDGQLALARKVVQSGIFFFAGRGGPALGGLSDEARLAFDSATAEFDSPPPAWTGWDQPGTQDVMWVQDDWTCDELGTTFRKCKLFPDGTCLQDDETPCPEWAECIVTHGKDDTPSGVLFDRTQAELATGRILLGVDGVGLLPSFVAAYARGDMTGQFAWLGFPYSGSAGAMAAEFAANGANGVAVVVDDVSPATAEKAGADFFDFALTEQVSAAEVLPKLGVAFSDHKWRLLGAGNVDLTYAGLINPDFATGNLRGWRRDGDARVLLDWCEAGPATNYMVVVSNGLGYAQDHGTISQEFCLTKDKLVFGAYYNFISHEFPESCGTEFHEDKLEMYMEDGDGQRVYLAATEGADFIGLNALCPCDAEGCGQCPESACGTPACTCGELNDPDNGEGLTLWPEECRFDAEGWAEAYASGWRYTGDVGLTNFGQGGLNKPVRLVMKVSDESSLKGNTAVLVDSFILK